MDRCCWQCWLLVGKGAGWFLSHEMYSISGSRAIHWCQMDRQICGTKWWKKRWRSRSRIPQKGLKKTGRTDGRKIESLERSFHSFRFHCPSVFKAGLADLDNLKSKLVQVSTFMTLTSRNSWHSPGLTGIASCSFCCDHCSLCVDMYGYEDS